MPRLRLKDSDIVLFTREGSGHVVALNNTSIKVPAPVQKPDEHWQDYRERCLELLTIEAEKTLCVLIGRLTVES